MKPPRDRTYTGHNDGRTVTVIRDGDPIQRQLTHLPRHSPTGFSWGYGGSGPADLARALLVDALPHPSCRTCGGSGQVVWIGEDPQPYNSLVELSADNDVEGCTAEGCDEGYTVTPDLYQRFKSEVVAVLPRSWTVTRAEMLTWMTDGTLPKAVQAAAAAAG